MKSVRALAPWEKGDIDQICQADFSRAGQIKLDVSVYDVEAPNLVRLHAEHQASAAMYLQSGKWIDVTGILQGIQHTPGTHPFGFARNAHCNADLPDEPALRIFIRKLLVGFAGRFYPVAQKDVRAYVRQQKAAADQEWLRFFKSGPVGASWEKI